MAWTRIKKAPTAKDRAAVEVGCGRKSSRRQEGLMLVLRTGKLSGLAFLRPGARIDALRGEGEHAGRLRIEHGAEFRLFQIGRRMAAPTLILRGLPMPAGVPVSDRKPEPVEFQVSEDGIEIVLPHWAVAMAQAAQPAPVFPPQPARTGYVGISERVPDPAAALRARVGR